MAPHKSPGMDGFPAAFYQLEADLFAEILCLVFKYQLSRGELLGIQRRSAVSLLFKGGDRSNPGNYRPIALIPVEVKILTRALAYRLRDLLPALIHPIQTGFVAGRRIHDHIIFLKDLQHSVLWTTSKDTLCFWTLKKRMIASIGISCTTFWKHSTSSHHPLGHQRRAQSSHLPTRGVKQGDPLSALLFVLSVEPLSQLLRNHEEYSLPFSEELFAMAMFFADDTTLVRPPLKTWNDNWSLSKNFVLSQTYLDIQTLHGYLGYSNKVLGDIVWPPFIRPSSNQCASDSFYQSFITWAVERERYEHYTAVIHIPEDTIAKWQSMVYKFILARKRHKEDKHMIPHIASRIRAQRVQRLQLLVQTDNEEPSLWSVLPKQLIRRCMEPFARHSSWDCLMYHPNHNTNHMRLEVLPLLWRKIWDNWHRIPLTRKCPETPTQSHLLTMSIWLQVHPLFLVPGSNGPTSLAVALKHHRPFYKFLAQEGLHCLDDFVTAQRVWPSYEEFKLQMESHVWRFPGDDFPRVFSPFVLTAFTHCDQCMASTGYLSRGSCASEP
ncbi:hypothetical protein Ae201684P_021690 [Aphanomyces euteiches]|nr:hypothetical protein Ae201684P_021690 [Aphanomyces euteiches]